MFNVRLAGGHLYGKQLFTWLSLVVSFMACFVLSFFPLDVLDGIWDLIESFSEGFLTYSLVYFHVNFWQLCPTNFSNWYFGTGRKLSEYFNNMYVSLQLFVQYLKTIILTSCSDLYLQFS